MYLNDLSASVQLQLNQLRDGSATANFAVTARFAQSASMAANIGTIPASRVPDLNSSNVFTAAGGGTGAAIVLASPTGPALAWNETGGAADNRLWDAVASIEGLSFRAVNDANTSATTWLRVERTGVTVDVIALAAASITISGTISGTISNATNAVNATNATNATTANTASTAGFALSAGSAALLSGLAPSDVAGVNTIAQRNSSGDLFARYFHHASGAESNSVGHIVTMTDLDGYFRVTPIATAGQYMEARNISGRTGTAKTISASAPAGGSNGDIHYQY